jgi:hypothetical protein
MSTVKINGTLEEEDSFDLHDSETEEDNWDYPAEAPTNKTDVANFISIR